MKTKRILFYLMVLMFSTQFFSSQTNGANQIYNDLCQKTAFYKESSKVYSFCVGQALQKTSLLSFFSHPISLTSSFFNYFFHSNQWVSILVSGGDYRSYSKKTIANHLAFSSFRNMVYFYACVNNFRANNDFLKAQWLKVQVLRDMLRDQNIPEDSWIAWVDDDLVFNYSDKRNLSMLDTYISRYSYASMIITTDTLLWKGNHDARFNTGVVMVRKNDIARGILHRWWHKRPDSNEAQERYNPPNQYGLKLMLEEYDYVATGDLAIAPQRASWGNMNTFHVLDKWETKSENGLAEPGDAAIQHPGLDVNTKHGFIMQSLRAISSSQTAINMSLQIYGSCIPDRMSLTVGEELEAHIHKCLHNGT